MEGGQNLRSMFRIYMGVSFGRPACDDGLSNCFDRRPVFEFDISICPNRKSLFKLGFSYYPNGCTLFEVDIEADPICGQCL